MHHNQYWYHPDAPWNCFLLNLISSESKTESVGTVVFCLILHHLNLKLYLLELLFFLLNLILFESESVGIVFASFDIIRALNCFV